MELKYNEYQFSSLNDNELYKIDAGDFLGLLIAAGLVLVTALVVCGTVLLMAAGVQWVVNAIAG